VRKEMNAYVEIRVSTTGETRYVAFELTAEQESKLHISDDEYVVGACIGDDDAEDEETWE
jgi:hypothetical protein